MAYFDHAATGLPRCSYAKAAAVDAFDRPSPGRGHHAGQKASQAILDAARAAVGALFPAHAHVVFTSGATAALNQAILGLVPRPRRIALDPMLHNAVRRTVLSLGVPVWILPCNPHGRVLPDRLARSWAPGTDLVVLTHASNVTGIVQPVEEIVAFARRQRAKIVVDAAQTVGAIALGGLRDCDMLCFSGHKGLRSLPGTGALVVKDGLVLDPRVWGGTGSEALPKTMPLEMPARLEPGTPNLPGIASLGAAARHHVPWPSLSVARRLQQIIQRAGFLPLVLGELPVVSFQVPGVPCDKAGEFLDKKAGLQVRTGLHCAPAAHEVLGTSPAGTVRISAGSTTTDTEFDALVRGLALLRASVR